MPLHGPLHRNAAAEIVDGRREKKKDEAGEYEAEE